jgi:hypothetical protein
LLDANEEGFSNQTDARGKRPYLCTARFHTKERLHLRSALQPFQRGKVLQREMQPIKSALGRFKNFSLK